MSYRDYCVVSVGPSLVDIYFELSSKEYREVLMILKSKPGGWALLEDYNQIKSLFCLLIGTDFTVDLKSLTYLQRQGRINVTAGSTNFGMMAALNVSQRSMSAIISAMGSDESGQPDVIAKLFTQNVNKLGLIHNGIAITGHNPLGMVFNSQIEPDKVLAMYPGVASDLAYFPTDITPQVLHVEAYELRDGKIANLIDSLIRSKKYRVALGCGNHSIIQGELRKRLLTPISHQDLDTKQASHVKIFT